MCFYNNPVFWTAASSIATFLAVCVALWQTKYTNRKRLKLKFNIIVVQNEANSELITDLVSCTVINNGNRKVILKSYFISMTKELHVIIWTYKCKITPVTLPQTLYPEDSIDLTIDKDDFINMARNLVREYPRFKKKRIKVCIVDSIGKVYSIKIKHTYDDWAEGM